MQTDEFKILPSYTSASTSLDIKIDFIVKILFAVIYYSCFLAPKQAFQLVIYSF